jgi:hypothetical protein
MPKKNMLHQENVMTLLLLYQFTHLLPIECIPLDLLKLNPQKLLPFLLKDKFNNKKLNKLLLL